jgi:hypothetical protein
VHKKTINIYTNTIGKLMLIILLSVCKQLGLWSIEVVTQKFTWYAVFIKTHWSEDRGQ